MLGKLFERRDQLVNTACGTARELGRRRSVIAAVPHGTDRGMNTLVRDGPDQSLVSLVL